MTITRGATYIKRLLVGPRNQSGLNSDGTLKVAPCKVGPANFMEKLQAASKFRLTEAEIKQIDRQFKIAESEGALPIWEGYRTLERYPRNTKGARTASQVSTPSNYGSFYVGLVVEFKPKVIVEFGAAYGVSGMYFLTGVNRIKIGHLYSFEPNSAWAKIGLENLSAISLSYTLQVGTFEENVDRIVEDKIDLAFVDAIHTSQFVNSQFELLFPRMADRGVIIFDDIDFSADMQSCWTAISQDTRAIASATVGRRQGIIQIRR